MSKDGYIILPIDTPPPDWFKDAFRGKEHDVQNSNQIIFKLDKIIQYGTPEQKKIARETQKHIRDLQEGIEAAIDLLYLNREDPQTVLRMLERRFAWAVQSSAVNS